MFVLLHSGSPLSYMQQKTQPSSQCFLVLQKRDYCTAEKQSLILTQHHSTAIKTKGHFFPAINPVY